MELIRLRIPFSFARARVPLNWHDMAFGLENELLELRAPIELAAEYVARSETPSAEVLELAGLGPTEAPRTLVDKLLAAEQVNTEDARDKWLYIVLSWIFEHRDEYQEPLRLVEEVYADFGYPESMAPFVRYMPSDEPDLGSAERNEERLRSNWAAFLEDCARRYGLRASALGGEKPD